MNIAFADQSGAPLAAGINVTITNAGAYAFSGTTQPSGLLLNVNLVEGTVYTASFFSITLNYAPLTFTYFPPPIITESGFVITTESGTTLVAEPFFLTVLASSAFTWSDFGYRVRALFPRSWAGDSAWSLTGSQMTNGRLASLVYGIAGGTQSLPSALPFIFAQLKYAKAQTRLVTITDTNVDQLGLDLFGGVLPRLSGALGTESDSAYAYRLGQALTAGCPSISGLETILQAYLNTAISLAAPQTTLSADTQGALDTQGAADVVQQQPFANLPPVGTDEGVGATDTLGFTDVAPFLGGTPTVVIFDKTSDPATSAFISLSDPQFAVFLAYQGASNNLIRQSSAITPAFEAIVRAFKAPGTIPIYSTNGPAN